MTEVAQQSVTKIILLAIMNLVRPKVGVGLWNILVLLKAAQQSVAKIIAMTIVTLATPKAGAKHELLFNKPASEVLKLNNLCILSKPLIKNGYYDLS